MLLEKQINLCYVNIPHIYLNFPEGRGCPRPEGEDPLEGGLGNTIVFSKLSTDVNLTGLDKLLRDLFLLYLTLSFSSIKAKSKSDISLTLAVNTGSLEKRYLPK